MISSSVRSSNLCDRRDSLCASLINCKPLGTLYTSLHRTNSRRNGYHLGEFLVPFSSPLLFNVTDDLEVTLLRNLLIHDGKFNLSVHLVRYL
ncbi:unnamed protein product [Thelazia callipaeda]|uniref:Ovule protein n=1 Tax=Thelazia callipaeda TaxID=103827 RepID=A0A0N5CJJ9_THECL|nr:unnamed protein product [Thelazia callipaeda]